MKGPRTANLSATDSHSSNLRHPAHQPNLQKLYSPVHTSHRAAHIPAVRNSRILRDLDPDRSTDSPTLHSLASADGNTI